MKSVYRIRSNYHFFYFWRLLPPAECHILPRCSALGPRFLYRSLWSSPFQRPPGSLQGHSLRGTSRWANSSALMGGLGEWLEIQEMGRRAGWRRREGVKGEEKGDSWSEWWRGLQWPAVWRSNRTPENKQKQPSQQKKTLKKHIFVCEFVWTFSTDSPAAGSSPTSMSRSPTFILPSYMQEIELKRMASQTFEGQKCRRQMEGEEAWKSNTPCR